MPSVAARIAALDWPRIERELFERGFSTTGRVLAPAECGQLIALYPARERFRSRIDMERLRFGRGEYKYFARPLPAIIEQMRAALYAQLAPIANRWAAALGADEHFPPALDGFLERCRRSGQSKPTPLLLRYEAGGYNCLHQDLYGEIAFPLQFTCVLSRRGDQYKGGELLFVEQRPRAQSRGDSLVLEQGEGVIFANRYHPIQGARGYHRATMRHGITTLASGVRYAVGIIFHDAK
jgi:uncharacterized protein